MKFLRHAAIAALSIFLFTALSFAEEIVSRVSVQGLMRLPEAPILKLLKTASGSPYDETVTRADIKTLYATGNFETVAVAREEGGAVIFIVKEKPALHDWAIEGDDRVKKEDLDKDFPLKPGEVLNGATVEAVGEAIRKKYHEKGYYLARVTPDIRKLDDEKNRADLVYLVEKGEKVQLEEVHISGVESSDEKKLRSGLSMPEQGFWTWVTGSANFNREELDRDIEWITSYYSETGRATARVEKPIVSLSPDLESVKVDIPVVPGPAFNFGKISFSGDSELSLDKLKEMCKVKEGELFSSKTLRETVWALEEAHFDLGYAYADVRPMTSMNPDEKTIDLNFVVKMGEKVKIGRIDIHGNNITRDRVIRREFSIAEGEWFSGSAIRNSQRKVSRLGFFEAADFDFKKRPGESVVDVDVSIKEQPTGSVSAGGGYSTTDGIFGMVSIAQRNLFGYGYQLSLNGNFGVSHDTYTLTFNNPRLFDSDIYGGVDFYKSFREYDEYNRKSIGFTVRSGLALDDDWSTRIAYTLDSTEMYDICTQEGYDAGTCTSVASVVVQAQEGKRMTASVRPSIVYDSRDNQWEATTGLNVKGSVEYAGGPLGHDSDYIKYEAEAKKYFSMPADSVFTVEGHGGYLKGLKGDDVPIYERFALGGMYSIRGFGWRDIGPKDSVTGEVIGGDKYLQFNAEYLYPLVKEAKLKLVLFYDTGNAWDVGQDYFDTPMRMSTGVGFRWFSPMGPLRLEYGHILDKKDGEDGSRWDFSIGGFF